MTAKEAAEDIVRVIKRDYDGPEEAISGIIAYITNRYIDTEWLTEWLDQMIEHQKEENSK